MKQIITALFFGAYLALLFSCSKSPANTIPANSDSFQVTVNNGYGSARYKTGDTVHVFSEAWASNQVFGKWSGDVSLLQAPDEWHTWFIMPNRNITVTGSLKTIPSFMLNYELIRGRDRLKPVYYYFPAQQKGIVYLLHGTSGNADNIANSYEWQQLIKDLINDQFAVVITEAEESTLNTDTNGDGKIRWALMPADTITNVDYANIRIITDTFYNRRIADRSKPRYSIGMSNGGFFSGALSFIYNFKASVQYCAQGSANLMQITNIPTQFCMAANDNNDQVGIAGDAEALSNSIAMNKRGVCSKYYVNERSPLYPERFARTGEISLSQSAAIFNELKSKGYIDSQNYYIGYSDKLVNDFKNNPASFSELKSLSTSQLQAMLEQINISVADHHIYSDYNRATVKFLNSQCQ